MGTIKAKLHLARIDRAYFMFMLVLIIAAIVVNITDGVYARNGWWTLAAIAMSLLAMHNTLLIRFEKLLLSLDGLTLAQYKVNEASKILIEGFTGLSEAFDNVKNETVKFNEVLENENNN